MNCEKCNKVDSLISINNTSLVDSGYPLGIKICTQCYSKLPKFILVINIETNKEEYILESNFNNVIYKKI